VVLLFFFSLSQPFNDWSFNVNPELFGQYGSFIGGFVGTIFSLVAVFFLYKTLITQQNTLESQNKAIKLQRQNSEFERFESTFFNLLKTQQEIANNIKTYFYSIDENIMSLRYTVQGREFFSFAKNELSKIWSTINSSKYLGKYDKSYRYIVSHQIDELFDSNNPKFTSDIDAEFQKKDIINNEKLSLVNKQYRISKEVWNHVCKLETDEKLKIGYGLFFKKYNYVVGHYFRHLDQIICFTNQFESINPDKKDISKKYIEFIRAQMSSYEMMLLFYYALSKPKFLKLLILTNFFEILSIDDLIDKSHDCIEGIKLNSNQI